MNQPCLVIMAAGMGSRFGGPKQTTPVDEYGHFLLHYSLFDAYRAVFRKVVFVVKEDTAEEFRESVGPAVAAAFDVRYAYQKLDTLPAGYAVPDGRTKPWGTAHAVLCAAPEIDGPFAVINSDDFYGRGAFTAIVTALVNDIINPLISLIIGGLDFSGLNIGVFPIGDLIMSIINFLCISLVVFWMVKIINRFNRTKEKEPEPEAPAKPTTDELLADILAELKLQSGRAEAAETLDAAEKEESSASER